VGQKTHPIGFRLGVIKDWDAKWFSALAAADCTVLDTILARGVWVNLRMSSASSTRIPRTLSTTLRSLWADAPTPFTLAVTSILLSFFVLI